MAPRKNRKAFNFKNKTDVTIADYIGLLFNTTFLPSIA